MPLQVFVVGAPRSGTTMLAEWINKVGGVLYMEEESYLPHEVATWNLPLDGDWVFKWCHLGAHAVEVREHYPNARIVDVYRDMLNTVYSMAYPKTDAYPYRPFEHLSVPGGRTLNALTWWACHRSDCERLCALYPPEQVCRLRYAQLPESRKKLSDFLGRVLPPLPFTPRNIEGLRLYQTEAGQLEIGF